MTAGLDPEEAKAKEDLFPKEFRDKIQTLLKGKRQADFILMNQFHVLFDAEQLLDVDDSRPWEEGPDDDGDDE